MEKPPDSQTERTFCSCIYSVYHSSIIFPYKLYKYPKGCCWNRQVFKTVSGSSVETQVSAAAGGTADTQTMKFFKITPQLCC